MPPCAAAPLIVSSGAVMGLNDVTITQASAVCHRSDTRCSGHHRHRHPDEVEGTPQSLTLASGLTTGHGRGGPPGRVRASALCRHRGVKGYLQSGSLKTARGFLDGRVLLEQDVRRPG